MLLTVNTTPQILSPTFVQFVVPGEQTWQLRSVCLIVTTGAGGVGTRGYLLGITDGTNLVAAVGNADATTDPASGFLTWANAPASSTTYSSIFSSIAPIPNLTLKAGYTILLTIGNAVPGDQIDSAVVWYDFTSTAA